MSLAKNNFRETKISIMEFDLLLKNFNLGHNMGLGDMHVLRTHLSCFFSKKTSQNPLAKAAAIVTRLFDGALVNPALPSF